MKVIMKGMTLWACAVLLPLVWCCGPPHQLRRVRFDGDVFHTKRLRNSQQCFNLCWSTTPCTSVNFNFKHRSCKLMSNRPSSQMDFNMDFNNVYAEVNQAQCKSFSSPCDQRPCKKKVYSTCVSSDRRYNCIFTQGTSALCPPPKPLAHAKIKGRGRTNNAVLRYHCEQNYRFSKGNGKITCQVKGRQGKWTKLRGECRALDCRDPAPKENADVTRGPTVPGSKRMYTCKHNTSLTATVTCLKNESWTHLDLKCPVDCGPPPNVKDAQVDEGSTVEGSKRVYWCEGNAALNDNPIIHCLENGTWSSGNFSCDADCGDPAVFDNAETIRVDSTLVKYVCHDGFRHTPKPGDSAGDSGLSRCQANRMWSSVNFNCNPVDCGKPDNLENSSSSYNSTLMNSTAVYKCDDGYKMSGEATIVCQSNASWTAAAFSCKKVQCTCPTGQVTVTSQGVDQNVTFICDNGTEFSELQCVDPLRAFGDNSVACGDDGDWVVQNFSCQEMTPMVLIAVKEEGAFYTIDTVTKNESRLGFTPKGQVQDVDFSPQLQLLFWVEEGGIYSAKLSKDERHTVVMEDGIGGFVRVDGDSRQVFYVVRGNESTIKSFDLSTNDARDINNVDTPLAMEIDPAARHIYWAEWMAHKKLLRMSYDGTQIDEVVQISECVLGPWAIHMDPQKNLYWSVNDEIHMREPDATAQRNDSTVLMPNLRNICDNIRTHQQNIYVSCTNDSTVRVFTRAGTQTTSLTLSEPIRGEKFITIIY